MMGLIGGIKKVGENWIILRKRTQTHGQIYGGHCLSNHFWM